MPFSIEAAARACLHGGARLVEPVREASDALRLGRYAGSGSDCVGFAGKMRVAANDDNDTTVPC